MKWAVLPCGERHKFGELVPSCAQLVLHWCTGSKKVQQEAASMKAVLPSLGLLLLGALFCVQADVAVQPGFDLEKVPLVLRLGGF